MWHLQGYFYQDKCDSIQCVNIEEDRSAFKCPHQLLKKYSYDDEVKERKTPITGMRWWGLDMLWGWGHWVYSHACAWYMYRAE